MRPRTSSLPWHVSSIITCLCHLVSLPFSRMMMMTSSSTVSFFNRHRLTIDSLFNQSITLFHVSTYINLTSCVITANNTIYQVETFTAIHLIHQWQINCLRHASYFDCLSDLFHHCTCSLPLSPLIPVHTQTNVTNTHRHRHTKNSFSNLTDD